jgi:hypothetical protein
MIVVPRPRHQATAPAPALVELPLGLVALVAAPVRATGRRAARRRPGRPSIASRLLTALMIGGLLAMLLGVAITTPAHAAESTRGVPDNCAALPWGTSGCEDHLGAAVRRDLIAERGVQLAEVSDFRLGQVVMALCFNRSDLAASQSNAADRPLVFNLTHIRAVAVPRRCG